MLPLSVSSCSNPRKAARRGAGAHQRDEDSLSLEITAETILAFPNLGGIFSLRVVDFLPLVDCVQTACSRCTVCDVVLRLFRDETCLQNVAVVPGEVKVLRVVEQFKML